MNKIMKKLGLTEASLHESEKYTDLFIGRVSSQSKNLYKAITVNGEMVAEIAGKYHYEVSDITDYPAVGDFVMLDRTDDSNGNGIIHQILSRKSVFARKMVGTREASQIVATNINTIFICMSLNEDYNLRRLERYLSIAWDSGALPVIVLTKSDLCEDIAVKLNEIASIAIGADILVTTSMSEDGYQSIKKYLYLGQTVAFIGSSGVGKSTLINRFLCKNILETRGIRDDDKGRHTTTSRELFVLPNNSGVVIDTPGMRELGIIHADLTKAFTDIADLSLFCKFNDCTHRQEPKCAVQNAIKEGTLSFERLESYWKLQKETKYQNLNSRMIEKEKMTEMLSGNGVTQSYKKFRKAVKEQTRNKRR